MTDARTMAVFFVNIPKRDKCPVCSKKVADIVLQNCALACSASPIEEVDCTNRTILNKAILVDVREIAEWDAGHIAGARHFPLSVLQKNPRGFIPLENGKICLLYCQKGARSKKAAQILLAAGFSGICSLKGGYEEWCASNI
jgi:adenylyltransferase/sulfurtransferase